MMKKLLSILTITLLSGCSSNARVASHNISEAAENFEINRRVVFYDSIQGTYILSIEGLCSIEADRSDKQVEVTCKTSAQSYKKHYLGIANNVTYFAEQLEPSKTDVYRYRVIFKPESIVPDIELKTSASKS